jgi:hypothetical protein
MSMPHNILPVSVSIDGSLDRDGVATVIISIVAPDIWDTDTLEGKNWQHRIARVLLIRSWRLPKRWGTSQASINMAEAIGFL